MQSGDASKRTWDAAHYIQGSRSTSTSSPVLGILYLRLINIIKSRVKPKLLATKKILVKERKPKHYPLTLNSYLTQLTLFYILLNLYLQYM